MSTNIRTPIALQYEPVALAVGEARNICVVGDEDQSIYRGVARRCRNILRFDEDYAGARVVRLEEIIARLKSFLDAAAGVVSNNKRRLGRI